MKKHPKTNKRIIMDDAMRIGNNTMSAPIRNLITRHIVYCPWFTVQISNFIYKNIRKKNLNEYY